MRENRGGWDIAEGDVASDIWIPSKYEGIDLLAGGVPRPPFTIAGKQLSATDERDLFAWAVELCSIIQPRALLLENVRGLSLNRFAAYRQHPTREGKVYCAVVLDTFSRRVAGWSIDSSPNAALVTNTLGMAIDTRTPPPARSAVRTRVRSSLPGPSHSVSKTPVWRSR